MDGGYVVLEDEDFEAADAVKTKMIEIINLLMNRKLTAFIMNNHTISNPKNRQWKAYALLRDALQLSGKVGVTSLCWEIKKAGNSQAI